MTAPVFSGRLPTDAFHPYVTIPWSSADELASRTHFPGEQLTVYRATGGMFAVLPTTTGFVMLLVAPLLSVTVKVTLVVWGPLY